MANHDLAYITRAIDALFDAQEELFKVVGGVLEHLDRIDHAMGDEHHVIFGPDGYVIEHSFDERLTQTMGTCSANAWAANVGDQPRLYGRHKIAWSEQDNDWIFLGSANG